jgi:hypothetical protein
MSWNDIMRRVLPPIRDAQRQWNVTPYVKSPYGDTNGPPGSSNPHTGVDFNYIGHDAATFNQSHPALRAPVTGVVTQAGEGKYGTIGIRDANGLLHQILHTHSRSVAVGDPVVAGQLIGRMGDTGVVGSNPKKRLDHAHYQLFDAAGTRLNPTEYWDQQGRVDPNPAPPAHLDDYQRYRGTPGAAMGDTVTSAPPAGSQTVDPADAAAEARKNVRVLGRLVPGRAVLGGQDVNAPATVPNQIPTTDRSPTFAERFGSWASSPTVTAPLSPYQPVSPQPQSDKPPGIVTGQPMPNIPLPPWVFGLPDPSQTAGDEAWSLGRLGRANWSKK